MELTRVNAVKTEWISDLESEIKLRTKWITDERNKLLFFKNEIDLMQLEKTITPKDVFHNKESGLKRLLDSTQNYIDLMEKSVVNNRIKLYILRGDPK